MSHLRNLDILAHAYITFQVSSSPYSVACKTKILTEEKMHLRGKVIRFRVQNQHHCITKSLISCNTNGQMD